MGIELVMVLLVSFFFSGFKHLLRSNNFSEGPFVLYRSSDLCDDD